MRLLIKRSPVGLRKRSRGFTLLEVLVAVAVTAIIAAMAGGSLTRALRLYQANWIERRDWLIKELDSLSTDSVNRLLAFGDQLAENKDDLPDALEVLKSWLRDLIVAKIYPDNMINRETGSHLQQTSQDMSLTSLLSKFETIQSSQNAIRTGTNLRLAMESMVLKLSRV